VPETALRCQKCGREIEDDVMRLSAAQLSALFDHLY
jgi:hypothetical protein